MRKIIEKCPACQDEVIVTRISCTRCECQVTGQFLPTIFNRLKPESLAFVETFVRLRGNIKEMERELGVPYSTIRNRLDEVILELGFVPGAHIPPAELPDPPESPEMLTASRQEILKRLEAGEITAEDAAEELGRVR